MKLNCFNKLILLTIITVSFTIYSCAPTYQSVYPEPVNIKTIITPGESVRVTTKDGIVHEFVVTEITDEALIGESNKILFKEINQLQEMTVTAEEKTNNAMVAAPVLLIFIGAAVLEGAANYPFGSIQVDPYK